MKTKTVFVCNSCGYKSPKWHGKCPECSQWNTFEEKLESVSAKNNSLQLKFGKDEIMFSEPESLESLWKRSESNKSSKPFRFSIDILNTFWGGGVHKGSVTLLAGEPGLGKSTFGLQTLRSLYLGGDKPVCWYLTAEESTMDMAKRAARLDLPGGIILFQSNSWIVLSQSLEKHKPDVVVLDSIQTITDDEVTSNPGSVSQVTSVAVKILQLCKTFDIAVIIVGHVTKEGQIAGPKTLEHLVDSVLLLESTDMQKYRTLSFQKHRYGSTEQLLLLKMEENGLQVVTNPSLAMLENIETGIGVAYGMTLDKNLPLIVEIQSLVSSPSEKEGNWYGKREAIGIKTAKLNTILAILEKHCGIVLRNKDVYVQVNGLPPNLNDDSIDLPLALSILSSLANKSLVEGLFKSSPSKKSVPVFSARLTLSGTIRAATQNQQREDIASSLGFEYNPRIDTKKPLEQLIKLFK